MGSIKYGILTVSDRCFQKETVDIAGNELTTFIEYKAKSGTVCKRACVPDDIGKIQATLLDWSNENENLDVILTTGGTGFSPRDVTPEATKSVIEREAPGLIIAILTKSLEITKMAMLSRGTCGIRRRSIILNLPGSTKGAIECLGFVIDQLKHAVDLVSNNLPGVAHQHRLMQHGVPAELKSSINPANVADRDRKSRFESISVPLAQEIIIRNSFNLGTDLLPMRNCLGFVLAENIHAKDPLPPFPASIKDGYAVKVYPEMKSSLLRVGGGTTAGDKPGDNELGQTHCVRISTGAPVPSSADAVIQIEDTELVERSADNNEEQTIRLLSQPRFGQDIRKIGSDIAQGQIVLEKGMRLGPAELGILASVGGSHSYPSPQIPVFRKPTIAILSTGNELQDPNDGMLHPGKIRDSNKTTLLALFQDHGFSTVDIGIARDTPDDVLRKLVEAMDKADIVVSTGGVSMGERDYLAQVMVKDLNAEIHFGSVLMKPGKPTKFATCSHNGKPKLIFGLPGNPVSATVTSILFVLPACRKMSNWIEPLPLRIKASVTENLPLDPTRPEYHRGHISWGDTQSPVPKFQSTGNQASSRLASCITANALLCLPQGTDNASEIKQGELVDCILLSL